MSKAARAACQPSAFAGVNRLGRPEQKRAVEAEGGDGVSGREAPAGVVRLDDLEPVRDPLDAGQERSLVHVGLGRTG